MRWLFSGVVIVTFTIVLASAPALSLCRHSKAWFPYRYICRICHACRTKKIHRTDIIHSISYSKLYLSFLLYWAFVREISMKLYLSYEFFSYDRHDRYDRYNDMETRLKRFCELSRKLNEIHPEYLSSAYCASWLLMFRTMGDFIVNIIYYFRRKWMSG